MKRITREQIATIAGTYEPPAPKKAQRSVRFMPRVAGRPRDLALRSKSGGPCGPRGQR